MKTREEILNMVAQKWGHSSWHEMRNCEDIPMHIVEDAMEEYATQQTAELQKEIERLKGEGWVSVEDRLPEINETVIAFRPKAKEHGDCEVRIIIYTGVEVVDHTNAKYAFSGAHHVTHWQPLPKPPQS